MSENKTVSLSRPQVRQAGWWTRDNALIVVLVAATALLIILCWLLAKPFVGPLAWALALAVIGHPLHQWVARQVKNPGVAAGLTVLMITILVISPAIFVGYSLVREASGGVQAIGSLLQSGQWQEQLDRIPWLSGMLASLEQQGNLESQLQEMIAQMGKQISYLIVGSAWAFVELLITLFVLFYLLRDRSKGIARLYSLVPLSEAETDQVSTRVADTIHATVFGTLVVAALQGSLGGLMFWWLGLPAPILWGAVMSLLAIVPVFGTFIIWVPAAIFLAANGQWGKAAILAAWGGIVIALVDNLVYPILVGKRLRLHTVPVFFAIVGGLAIFGAAGLILGPVILALTDATLEIWRRRTANARPAEAATRSRRR